jgi:hypothetical protein
MIGCETVKFLAHTDRRVPVEFKACKPKPRTKKRGPKGRGKARSK